MAFYQDNDEEELVHDPNASMVAQTSPQSATLTGQGASNAGTQAKTNAPDSPGNFVGIKQYLDANKSQAGKLGDQAAGVIQTSADQARNSINDLNTAANENIQGATKLSDDILSRLNQAETLTDAERNQIKQTAVAQYKGPNNETELGDAYKNALSTNQKAQQNVANSGTEEGRMSLVSQINTKPRNQGMNVFDNALLQSGGGREKLATAANANKDVKGALDAASEAIRNKIDTTKNQTQEAQKDAYSSVQNALNNWKSNFTPRVQQAQQQLSGLQNRITSDIADNPYGLDQETMDLLGLKAGQDIYGVNLNNYLKGSMPSDISAANIANQEDYHRYAAIADLAGEQDLLLRPENISQAGKAYGFNADKDRLAKDIAASDAAYKNAYNTSRNVLDLGLLEGGSVGARYSGGIPGALTERRDLDSATAADLESFWIPLFDQAAASHSSYNTIGNAIKKSLANWKRNQHSGNVVKKN
jgi:hypothetical protein